MAKIVIIGAGYVGLVTGACFARHNTVIVVEKDSNKIERLQQGLIPFYEPGLGSLVQEGIARKHLFFSGSLAKTLTSEPDVVFICVGTPSMPNGGVDLSAIFDVAHEIGSSITHNCIVVTKSTVPVGTTRFIHHLISRNIEQKKLGINCLAVSNPEFLKEGDALHDFLNPDRVVVGTNPGPALEFMRTLYKPFLAADKNFICMKIESAELTKYAANAMLAARISFMNELAGLADATHADIKEVKEGLGSDNRIGNAFLNAGVGYGGSCLPKDLKALVHMAKEHNISMPLVETIESVNNIQRTTFLQSIFSFYNNSLAGKKVGIWGLSFKPETDDIRSAPSLDIIEALLKRQTHITVYDPIAMNNIKTLFGNALTYATTKEEVVFQSDFLIILTEWSEFLKTPVTLFAHLADQAVFDGRNCFNPQEFIPYGIRYVCVGRNTLTVPKIPLPLFKSRPSAPLV